MNTTSASPSPCASSALRIARVMLCVALLAFLVVVSAVPLDKAQAETKTSTGFVYDDEFNAAWEAFPDFSSIFTAGAHPIPGLEVTNVDGQACTNMVPQGICTTEKYILVTAYDSEKEFNSVIYVLDKASGGYLVTLVTDNNKHAGGIACGGGSVYVAGSTSNCVYEIPESRLNSTVMEALQDKKDSVSIAYEKASLKTGCTASFLTYYKGLLWVGVCDTDGNGNGALNGFERTADGLSCVKQIRQCDLYNAKFPDYANGAAFYESNGVDYLMVIQSPGRHENTTVYRYAVNLASSQIFADFKLDSTLTWPCMGEEICFDGEVVYQVFESAAATYGPKNLINPADYTVDRICMGSATNVLEGTTIDSGIWNNTQSGSSNGQKNHATYSYSNQGKKLITSQIDYHPDIFFTDARELSGDVAKFCVGFAAAAYDQTEVTKCMNTLGFNWVTYNYARKGTLKDCDFVAYTIGHKAIEHDGKTYNLWVVPVRGTPQNSEWFSDFHLGNREDGYHDGFKIAADEVLRDLRRSASTSNNIIVLTGHSRGAAVANIVAGELTKKGDLASADRIFAYTFACPAVSLNANTSYGNIRNYNAAGDAIPSVPLADWGYKRYGQTLPLNPDQKTLDNSLRRFKSVMGRDYEGIQDTEAFVGAVKAFASTSEDFLSEENKLWFDVLAWKLGGSKEVSLTTVLAAHTFTSHGNFLQMAAASVVKILANETLSGIQASFDSSQRNDTSLIADINKALDTTAGMTQEQFDSWLGSSTSASDLKKQLSERLGITLRARSDLVPARTQLESDTDDISWFMNNVLRLYHLYLAADGNLMGAVNDAHLPVTYIVSINSQFFGYEGWANCPDEINYTMSEGNKILGASCFSYASGLKNFTVSDDYLLIGQYAINNCHSIETITVPCDLCYNYNTLCFSNTGAKTVHYTPGKTGVMPDYEKESPSSAPSNSWACSPGYASRATLERVVYDEGITHIGAYSLCNNGYAGSSGEPVFPNLAEVSLPSTLESIGSHAFYKTSGHAGGFACELPASLSEIGSYAFAASSMAGPIGEVHAKIGSSAFSGCGSLAGDLVVTGGAEVGERAFMSCTSLSSLTVSLPETRILYQAFKGCGIQSATLPADLSFVGTYAFEGCPLKVLRYTPGKTGVVRDYSDTTSVSGNSWAYSPGYAARATLERVVYDEGITHIGAYSLSNMKTSGSPAEFESLTEVSLPSTLETVGKYAFYCVGGFQDVVFPEGVTSIGYNAFTRILSTVRIYGYKGTCVETHATQKGYTFIPLYYPAITSNADQDVLQYGGVYQFNATAKTGIDTESSDAEWSISGQLSEITAIDSSGKLSVGADETSTAITVTATIGGHSNSKTYVAEKPPVVAPPELALTAEASAITYGQSLASSTLTCKATHADDANVVVQGTFDWDDESIRPAVSDSGKTHYKVNFVPLDENYDSASVEVTVVVAPAEYPEDVPQGRYSLPYSASSPASSAMPDLGQWAVDGDDLAKELVVGKETEITVVYTGTDAGKGNYEHESTTITVVRSACQHLETETRNEEEATCTHAGYSGDVYCKECQEIIAPGYVIEPSEHRWGDWSVETEATCTEEGTLVRKCQDCTAKESQPIPAAHVWNEASTVDRPASCLEDGSKSIHCARCGEIKPNSEQSIPAVGHHDFGEWETVQAPTATTEGLEKRSCSKCDAFEQRTTPIVETPPDSGSGTGSGSGQGTDPSSSSDQGTNPGSSSGSTNPPSGSSLSGGSTQTQPYSSGGGGASGVSHETAPATPDTSQAHFAQLMLKGTGASASSIKLSWKGVPGATSYGVFISESVKSSAYNMIGTTPSCSFVHNGLAKASYYRYYVAAYAGQQVIAVSQPVYVATTGGKAGNAKSVKIKLKKKKLKVGKKTKISAKQVAVSKKTKISKLAAIRYESSNPAIATVSNKGTIKGISKGTCTIYAYAQNGAYKSAKIKVR